MKFDIHRKKKFITKANANISKLFLRLKTREEESDGNSYVRRKREKQTDKSPGYDRQMVIAEKANFSNHTSSYYLELTDNGENNGR